MPLSNDIDLLNPPLDYEKRKHKLKRLVPAPDSFFMDVKCPGCFNITTIFSHSQTVVSCSSCAGVLCTPTGGKAKLSEDFSHRTFEVNDQFKRLRKRTIAIMISNFDWSTLIDDVWLRVLRAFYPDDLTTIARLMCTCRSLQRAGKTLLSTAETCDKKRSNGNRDNVVIAWLMKHSPKLSILKTPVLSKELRLPPTLTPVMRNLTQLHLHSAILKHHHLKCLFQNEKSCQIRFPNLTHLALKSCKFEGSGNEKWLTSLAFPNLTSLDLSWCMNLTPKMVADVVFKLDYVSFHGCCDIDNFIIPRLYNVERLDLAFTSISDEGLGVLAAACLSLRTLILADPTASNNWVYGSWTEPGLTKLKQRRPNVDIKLVTL